MLTIEKASNALGLSSRQLRRRLAETRPLLARYIRRGPNNRLLLDGGAIEVLRAIEDYRANGYTVKQAMDAIADSIEGKEQDKGERSIGNQPGKVWEMLIAEKDARIQALESEVAFLRQRVEELTRLALPKPRRWFAWFLPTKR